MNLEIRFMIMKKRRPDNQQQENDPAQDEKNFGIQFDHRYLSQPYRDNLT